MVTRASFLTTRFGGYLHREVPAEDTELSSVGPDTPCGEYLRRFWQPICFSDELRDLPHRIKILGEELVAFRDQSSAVGSVTLANTTAETFEQYPSNADMGKVKNCFMCHNASSYSFQSPPPAQLKNRLVAISHTLSVGTDYAVPNMVSGNVRMLFFPGQ